MDTPLLKCDQYDDIVLTGDGINSIIFMQAQSTS